MSQAQYFRHQSLKFEFLDQSILWVDLPLLRQRLVYTVWQLGIQSPHATNWHAIKNQLDPNLKSIHEIICPHRSFHRDLQYILLEINRTSLNSLNFILEYCLLSRFCLLQSIENATLLSTSIPFNQIRNVFDFLNPIL